MNQSGGSSVQTEIFPPENIRFHTKYTKRHTDIMLGCFVVGEDKAFIIETDRIKTISQLRDAIKAYKENVYKNFDANKITLWKVDIPIMKKREINTDTNIAQEFGAVELEEEFDTIEEHFGTNPTAKHIHVIAYPPPTAGPSQQGVSQEEPLTMERIIETANIIKNKDKPVITMYDYIERTHIQEFIRKKVEINLKAFENESSRLNDYQGISISGGSGTGKTRHGFEAINIIKDLKQIKDGSFKPIHIFIQIFPESFLVRFDERPQRDLSLGRYPRNPSHVNSVGHYLALAIASYYFTKNYRQESLQYFKELAKSSTFDLITVLQAIQRSCSIESQQKLLILLQLDEYQRDEYLIANILRFTSQLVADQQVCDLKILIVPICTGTAPIKLRESGHLSVTDYNVYDVHMSPMDIENSLNFMDSVIDHKMKASNELTNPISRDNPLYRVLIGAVKGIAVIMEQCASELFRMKEPFDSAEQAKEIWKILVDWAKQKYSIVNWLDCVGGRKDPQDKDDEKRKKAILKLMFWIHTQKLISKDTALDDSTLEDHEAGGLIFLEEIEDTQYKVKAPLVLIVSLVSHLKLGFFDDIILDPFSRLDEESFPKFILHMHLITYRLADLIGICQMTIREIYFGCLLASNEVLSKEIDIQHDINYRLTPILIKKDYDDPKDPYTWNELDDRKKVSVIADAKNDKVENVDVTTGHFIVLVRRRSGSSDSLTPHAEEQYKFSSAVESSLPVHKTPTGVFTLKDFEKELKKATKSCECFIVMTVKRFLDEVDRLPSRVSGDLTTKTGIVFGDRFLEFMGIYGDFTRFIAEGISEKTMDEEESRMIVDD